MWEKVSEVHGRGKGGGLMVRSYQTTSASLPWQPSVAYPYFKLIKMQATPTCLCPLFTVCHRHVSGDTWSPWIGCMVSKPFFLVFFFQAIWSSWLSLDWGRMGWLHYINGSYRQAGAVLNQCERGLLQSQRSKHCNRQKQPVCYQAWLWSHDFPWGLKDARF